MPSPLPSLRLTSGLVRCALLPIVLLPIVGCGSSDGPVQGGATSDDSLTGGAATGDLSDTNDSTGDGDSTTPARPPSNQGSGCAESCSDTPPNGMLTCAQQARRGMCDESWMEGFCELSCDVCTVCDDTGDSSGNASGDSSGDPSDDSTENEPSGPPSPGGSAGKFVGNITTSGQLRSDFLDYWDQLTSENEGKWDAMEPSRDQMNWGRIDEQYRFAKDNGIPFKQHTFIWGSQEPQWVAGLSPAEQAEEAEEFMRLFCERYPDIDMIDVVNEPDHKTPSFAPALGAGRNDHGWVIWSFEKARQHCPNAILILNDYNVLRWDTDNFVSIANKVASRGLLDAIGAQAHGLEDITLTELKANFEKVASVGVPIYISEYDIDLADDAQQQRVMEEQFTFFYNEPRVAGITLWGYIHGATWVPNSGLIRNNSPRPAMIWLMDFLGR